MFYCRASFDGIVEFYSVFFLISYTLIVLVESIFEKKFCIDRFQPHLLSIRQFFIEISTTLIQYSFFIAFVMSLKKS